MRKLNLISGALGLAALGLAACSNDDLKMVESQKVEKDQTQYLAVSISTPTNYMTRDGEFENGTTDESAVRSLVFVFYDGAGNPTATMKTLSGEKVTQGWTSNTSGNDVTRFWTSVVPVEMTQGQDKPVYVVCYVNPIDQTNLAVATLTEVDAMVREAVYTKSSTTTGEGETAVTTTNYLFAMSNAVYYGDNPITGQKNVRMMATPILEGQLFPTEEEALAEVNKDSSTAVLDIYVERYAAKIGLTMASTAIQDYPVKVYGAGGTLTDGAIKFTPTAWRPNAIDEKTYVTKAFATGATELDPTAAPAYSALQAAFQGTGMAGQGLNGWNDSANHRSYWACSPSYYSPNGYPRCSDDITDPNAKDFDLTYFNYNDMVSDGIAWNNGFTITNTGNSTTGYFYSRETTASIENIKGTEIVDGVEGVRANYNNKAVVASAVIVGHYNLGTGTSNSDFWLFGKSEGKDIYYANETDVKNALISNQNVIFTDREGTTPVTFADLFTVMHPSYDVRKDYDENVAGKLVTIQINAQELADYGEALYFNNGTGIVAIDTDNLVAANRLLWKSASTAQYFNNGLAFFSIPIRHLGWDKNVNPNQPLLDATATATGRPSSINWQNLRRGDLGVVRNHVYTITVTDVSGLGVALGSPTQPIVPPMDPDNYYIAAKLNVLSWRVVPAQSVVL